MNTVEWKKERSDFNHGWLKNRLLITLSRAQKVLDGKVKDELIWEDLTIILSEWPTQRMKVERVLNTYLNALSPKSFIENSSLLRCEAEIMEWLTDLSHKHWLNSECPEKNLPKAWDCMAMVEIQAGVLNESLAKRLQKAPKKGLAKNVVELRIAASALSEALSTLGNVIGGH